VADREAKGFTGLADETDDLAAERTPSDTKEIAKYYQAWQLGSREIAELVASRHRQFFNWLKEQKQ
jgi:hypothetical protein